MNTNNNGTTNLERNLGRLEARVADLTEQIRTMRAELSSVAGNVDRTLAAHHERLVSLESFRRWALGVNTGLLMSAVAAAFAWAWRM
jgi:hypothetical protein